MMNGIHMTERSEANHSSKYSAFAGMLMEGLLIASLVGVLATALYFLPMTISAIGDALRTMITG